MYSTNSENVREEGREEIAKYVYSRVVRERAIESTGTIIYNNK